MERSPNGGECGDCGGERRSEIDLEAPYGGVAPAANLWPRGG